MPNRPKIKVRRDLTKGRGNFQATPRSRRTPGRRVITISNDICNGSQETESDWDASSPSKAAAATDKRSPLRTSLKSMEEYSRSSLNAWVAACRDEADAAVVCAKLKEERAQTAAAIANEALTKANDLAFEAEEAMKKALLAREKATAAKISARLAANFALVSLDAANKAEEAVDHFPS